MDAGANLDAYGDRVREPSQQVKLSDFFVSASQDEELGIRLLLAEPKREDFSIEGIFSFDNNNKSWNSSSSGVLLYNPLLGGIYKVNDDSLEANHNFYTEFVDEILIDADVTKEVETEHVLSEESVVLLRNSSNSDIGGSPPVLGPSEGSSLAIAAAEAECYITSVTSSSRTGICSPKTQRSKKSDVGSGKRLMMRWTSTEVAALVEGVAMIGTRRWNEIKKLMFSSFPRRKPDHLRRKWATLVAEARRAQEANKQGNGVKHGKEQAKARPTLLSKSLALRVLELASKA